jgi:predicted transcriptional regulator
MTGSGKTQISIRLPIDLYATLGRIADALERDRTWVILRALRLYVEAEGAEILHEADAIAALDRGEGVDVDRVMDEVDALIAEAESEQRSRKGG